MGRLSTANIPRVGLTCIRYEPRVGRVTNNAKNYLSPAKRIMIAVKRERKARKYSGDTFTQLINCSEHIGTIATSTYRNLESCYDKNAAMLTQAHVRAMADALGIPTSDIASYEDFTSLKPLPKNRSQWPPYAFTETSLTAAERAAHEFGITSPKTTALRIKAYQKQHSYSNTDLIAMLKKKAGYEKMPLATLGKMYAGDAQALGKITPEFIKALGIVFMTNWEPFDYRWLIQCTDTCPHCHEGYLSY